MSNLSNQHTGIPTNVNKEMGWDDVERQLLMIREVGKYRLFSLSFLENEKWPRYTYPQNTWNDSAHYLRFVDSWKDWQAAVCSDDTSRNKCGQCLNQTDLVLFKTLSYISYRSACSPWAESGSWVMVDAMSSKSSPIRMLTVFHEAADPLDCWCIHV